MTGVRGVGIPALLLFAQGRRLNETDRLLGMRGTTGEDGVPIFARHRQADMKQTGLGDAGDRQARMPALPRSWAWQAAEKAGPYLMRRRFTKGLETKASFVPVRVISWIVLSFSAAC